MFRHIKLCLIYDRGGLLIPYTVPHLAGTEDKRFFIISFYQQMSYMSCSLKASEYLTGFVDYVAYADPYTA